MNRILTATIGSLVLLAGLVFVLELPDPVAIHFTGDGTADGFASPAAGRAIAIGLPAVVAMVMLALTWSRRRQPEGMRWILGLPVGAVWGVGGIMLVTLVSQARLDDARDAIVPPPWIVLALGLGVVVTVAASRLARLPGPPTTHAPGPTASERADLPTGSALWVGQTPQGRAPLVAAILVVLLAVVLGILVAWWVALILLPVALLLVASTRFTITIGPAGVNIAGLVAGWPRVAIPLDTVVGARPRVIRPFEFGGWGLRTVPGLATTAVVTGSGPGLEVERTDGSRVVVSLDDPDRAAAVVTTLLDRRSHERDARGADHQR